MLGKFHLVSDELGGKPRRERGQVVNSFAIGGRIPGFERVFMGNVFGYPKDSRGGQIPPLALFSLSMMVASIAAAWPPKREEAAPGGASLLKNEKNLVLS